MKNTPKNIPSPYKFAGTKIFRDTTALPFADGGPLHDRNINGKLLNSTYASALGSMFREGGPFAENRGTFDYATSIYASQPGNYYANGGLIKRADGSYSQRGLWDNIRANKGSGKKPTKEMLEQEKKITNSYAEGGQLENKCRPGYYWNGKECVKSFIPTAKTKTQTVTKNKKEQELIDYGKKTLPNKKVTNNPVQNISYYGDISNVAQPDNLIENITEFADPTGYFSWDDAYRAKAAWDKSNSALPTTNQALDMFGAVPALGKLGKLKYLKNADAIKNSMKYVAPAFGIIPWQSILNKVDTGQDINQDNISYRKGGQFPRPYSLPEDSFKQGGTNLHNSVYASSPAQYPAVYRNGGMTSKFYASNVPDNNISNKDLTYPENSYVYAVGGNLNNSIMNKYPNVTNILRSGIHINPANKGKFTASANAAGMGVQEFASHVLANKDDYSSTQVKRANFARNAAGWKHEMGGNLNTTSPLTNMMGIPAKSMAMTFKYGGFNNPGFNALPKKVQAKIKARTFENGGTMPQLTEFNEGGRHEENPLGGIPQGVAGDGRLNLVEEGETKLNAANYIFSDTLKLDKGIAEAFNLPKGDVGKTFSDISKKLNRPNSRRDNDTIEQNAIQRDLENLMQAQEAFKEVDLQKDLEMMKTKHPELMEAMDMAMQQQSAQQQEPSPEEMQQGAPQSGSPEEQAMMEQQMMAQQEGMAPEEMAQIPMSYGGAMFMRGGKMCYADGGNLAGNLLLGSPALLANKMFNSGGRMYPAGGAMQNAYTVSGNMPAYDNRQFMSPVGMQNEPMFSSQEEAAAYMQNPTNEAAIAQWNNPETGMGGQVQSNFYLNPNQPGTLTYPGAGSNKQITRDLSVANTPQFSFMPTAGAPMATGFKTGGHMYGKGGQVLRSIGAGAYGVGEGLLDTLTFGLTDDLTDKGYNALANIGGRNEKDLERDAMIRGFGNTAGAIGGAVVSGGAATGSAISEGSEGLGQGLSNIHGTNAEFDKTVNSLAKMGSMAGGLVGGGNPTGALGGATGAAGIAEGATQVPQFAQTMMKAGQNPFLQQATGMAGSMVQRNGGSMYPSMYKYGGSFEMPRQQMYMPLDNVERMGGHMYVEGGIMDSDPPRININGKLYTKDEALQAANFGKIILEPEEINTYFSEFPSSNENYNLEYEGSLEDTDTDETNIQIQDEEDLANITYPGASNPNIITGGKGDYSEEILAAQNMLKNAKNPKDKADAEAYLSSLKRMQTDLENRNVDLKMKQTPMQALGLALPAAYNIGMGLFSKPMKFKEEEFVNKAKITPYKVNIDPQLNEARLAYNAAEQSVKNNAPSAGAYLSNRANLASLRAKSFKDVLAGKENADAQLQMQADLQNAQLGSQNLQNKLAIQQLNAQAEAAKQKMLQTGIGQVGQIAQNAQAMDAQEKYMRLISPQYGKTFEYQTIFDQVKDYYKNKKSSKETKE